ncbi:MAG: hypothetical protein ABI120_15790, partial [Gemmatimonadaceae bacterium]
EGTGWNDNFFTRDIVLNVNDMRRYSAGLGRHVTRTEIPGAIHDIMLSREDVRQNALQQMLQWLNATVPDSNTRATPSLV